MALSRRSEGRGGTVCDATRSASIAGFERKMRNLGGPRTPLFFFPRGWIVSSSRAFRSGGMVRRRYRREIDLNPALSTRCSDLAREGEVREDILDRASQALDEAEDELERLRGEGGRGVGDDDGYKSL